MYLKQLHIYFNSVIYLTYHIFVISPGRILAIGDWSVQMYSLLRILQVSGKPVSKQSMEIAYMMIGLISSKRCTSDVVTQCIFQTLRGQ